MDWNTVLSTIAVLVFVVPDDARLRRNDGRRVRYGKAPPQRSGAARGVIAIAY